jgi:hypothetical protein
VHAVVLTDERAIKFVERRPIDPYPLAVRLQVASSSQCGGRSSLSGINAPDPELCCGEQARLARRTLQSVALGGSPSRAASLWLAGYNRDACLLPLPQSQATIAGTSPPGTGSARHRDGRPVLSRRRPGWVAAQGSGWAKNS